MSPRRQIQPGEEPLLSGQVPDPTLWSRLPLPRLRLPRQWWKPSRSWTLPGVLVVAVLLAVGSIATSAVVLIRHQARHVLAMKEVDALVFVRSFMTTFTSLDPFHANDYVDRIFAHATGDFAKQYHDKQNEILAGVAQAEPTKGTTLEVGVERWNDDGSANVLAATEITSRTPDGKQVIEKTNRWLVVAQREGDQWKISSLQQVI
ncbi:hypothetical protein [Mycobacterium shimoidei]|uniref:hypothetical protein n=1 Tax=Mycobacterium shimoidei TaxID=29313 RepID=UPI0009FCB48A|nr:hypothetical protein [Mycobacterium shimoidei]MCV7258606.1 mammalian cell entry protein [Mycobacterium shimoidei]